MQLLAVLLAGFSIFAAPLLVLRECVTKQTPPTWFSKIAGLILIICLAFIQWLNLQNILERNTSLFSPVYILLLYCIAPSFYLYSYQTLNANRTFKPWDLLHVLPVSLCLFIPLPWSIPLAFVIGGLYLIWLARAIYLLRKQRTRFKLELLALGSLFCIALAVVSLGFIWPMINNSTFVLLYALLIGLAFFGATLTLLIFPSITTDVYDAAQATYVESTLKNIDRNQVLDQLTQLMQQEKIYRLETLSLAMVAEQLGLTPHQLSELINTEYQQGFSKFIRSHRIEEAKTLLIKEANASILSIGLAVGFSTQSNFYSAFRDIVGIAPGQYRKQHTQSQKF